MKPLHLVTLLRANGPVWCLRRAAVRVLGLIRRPARFLTWVFPALLRLSRSTPSGERRVLAIYDLSCQPFSVGDMLIMQEASLVQREKHNVDLVDFALVYDPKRPACPDPSFAGITEHNAMYHLASILPVAQANQHLGSVFIFNSHRHLERFIADNGDLYHVWPSGWRCATKEYLYFRILDDVLYNHFKEHGSLPRLTCRQFLVDRARAFYQQHVYPQVPVTVNVRNNKAHGTNRNLHLDAWLDFFRHCETRYPAKFVVICSRSEVDDRFRQCPNVVIAKDQHTGIEEDLALISTSAIHMGASSGPVLMAWFSDKPYLMVNIVHGPGFFSRPEMILQEEENVQRFWFSNPLQRFVGGTETTELLIKEFARMWDAVDIQRWQSAPDLDEEAARETATWLR